MTYSHNTPLFPLSDQQLEAVEGIIDRRIRILMGSAGTGKSAVIAEVSKRLGNKCLVLTPTHKTQINLTERGVRNVQQITGVILNRHVQANIFNNNVTHIIVDEAGMTERRHKEAILSYVASGHGLDIHVCFIGDPCQLDPVTDAHDKMLPIWFDRETPDFILTEGFRQDQAVTLTVVKNADVNPLSVTICMTNETRNQINLAAHVAKHGAKAFTHKMKTSVQLHPGDVLISYFTDSNQKYRNNCQYVIERIEDAIRPANKKEGERKPVKCWKIWFEGNRQFTLIDKNLFYSKNFHGTHEKRDWELAYAITCHSAQGSGFDDVTVYIERGDFGVYPIDGLNIQKWVYTAITRGKKRITVVDPTNAIAVDKLSLDMSIRQEFNPVIPPAKAEIEPSQTIPSFYEAAA